MRYTASDDSVQEGTKMHDGRQVRERIENIGLTLFNAVLVRALLLRVVRTGHTLNALIEVVLHGSALLGFLAFYNIG